MSGVYPDRLELAPQLVCALQYRSLQRNPLALFWFYSLLFTFVVLICHDTVIVISLLFFREMMATHFRILKCILIILLYGGNAADGKKFHNRI